MEAVTTSWPPLIECPECNCPVIWQAITADLKPAYRCGDCGHIWPSDYAESVARTVVDMLEVKNSLICNICDTEYVEGHTCAPGLRTKIDMLFEKLGQIEEKIGDLPSKKPSDAG